MKFFVLLGLLAVSIGANASDYSRVHCALPHDQKDAFLGAWDKLPVKLVFDEEFYSANRGRDAKALKRAVDTWNRWAKLKGKVAFVIEKDGKGMPIPKIFGCSQAEYTAAMPEAVGIWKITASGYRANQRESCGRDTATGKLNRILYFNEEVGTGVDGQTDWIAENGRISGASILLNFESFNAPGRQSLDIESMLVHELGHVLGLLHSCNGSAENAVDGSPTPGCSVAPREYTDAVMSPYSAFSAIRRLQKNDFARVNCLY